MHFDKEVLLLDKKSGVLLMDPVDAGLLDELVAAWVNRHRLVPPRIVEKIVDASPGRFSGLVLGDVRCHELRLLLACYTAWLMVVDDRLESESSESIFRVFDRTTRDPFANQALQALGDLTRRGRSLVKHPERWAGRFARNVDNYLLGCMVEANHRLQMATPAFDQYQDLRLSTSGAMPFLDILDLAHQEDLPGGFHERRLVEDFRRLAGFVFAWANDIIGFRSCRTEADKEDRLNLVAVVAKELGLEPGDARKTAFRRVYQPEVARLSDFMDRLEVLLGGSDPASKGVLSRYFQIIARALDGVVAWHVRSDRYQAESAVPVVLDDRGSATPTPSRADGLALVIPSSRDRDDGVPVPTEDVTPTGVRHQIGKLADRSRGHRSPRR